MAHQLTAGNSTGTAFLGILLQRTRAAQLSPCSEGRVSSTRGKSRSAHAVSDRTGLEVRMGTTGDVVRYVRECPRVYVAREQRRVRQLVFGRELQRESHFSPLSEEGHSPQYCGEG